MSGREIESFKNPPGRRPSTRLLRLSKWFQQLNPGDQAMLVEALKLAAEDAIFGFFCVCMICFQAVRSFDLDGPLA